MTVTTRLETITLDLKDRWHHHVTGKLIVEIFVISKGLEKWVS
jgi:hypothetical protein